MAPGIAGPVRRRPVPEAIFLGQNALPARARAMGVLTRPPIMHHCAWKRRLTGPGLLRQKLWKDSCDIPDAGQPTGVRNRHQREGGG
jgi:hypothetical protein